MNKRELIAYIASFLAQKRINPLPGLPTIQIDGSNMDGRVERSPTGFTYIFGPKDIAAFEKADKEYVFELERLGQLDNVEPELNTQFPKLYGEVMADRQQRADAEAERIRLSQLPLINQHEQAIAELNERLRQKTSEIAQLQEASAKALKEAIAAKERELVEIHRRDMTELSARLEQQKALEIARLQETSSTALAAKNLELTELRTLHRRATEEAEAARQRQQQQLIQSHQSETQILRTRLEQQKALEIAQLQEASAKVLKEAVAAKESELNETHQKATTELRARWGQEKTSEIAQLQEASAKTLKEAIAAKERQLTELTTNLSAAEEATATLRRDLAALTTEKSEIEQQLSTKTEAELALRRRLDTLTIEKDEAEAARQHQQQQLIQSHQSETEALRAQLEREKTSEIARLQETSSTALAEKDLELRALRTLQQRTAEEAEAARQRQQQQLIQSHQLETDALRAQLEREKTSEIAQLQEASAKVLKEANDAKERQLTELTTNLSAAEKATATLRSELAALTTEKSEAESALRQQLETLTREKDEAEVARQRQQAEALNIRQVQVQLELTHDRETAEVKARLDQQTAEIAQLRNSLVEALAAKERELNEAYQRAARLAAPLADEITMETPELPEDSPRPSTRPLAEAVHAVKPNPGAEIRKFYEEVLPARPLRQSEAAAAPLEPQAEEKFPVETASAAVPGDPRISFSNKQLFYIKLFTEVLQAEFRYMLDVAHGRSPARSTKGDRLKNHFIKAANIVSFGVNLGAVIEYGVDIAENVSTIIGNISQLTTTASEAIELTPEGKPCYLEARLLEQSPEILNIIIKQAAREAAARWDYFINTHLSMNQVHKFAVVGAARIIDYFSKGNLNFSVEALLLGLTLGNSGKKGDYDYANHHMGDPESALTAEGAYSESGIMTPRGQAFASIDGSKSVVKVKWVDNHRKTPTEGAHHLLPKYGYIQANEEEAASFGFSSHKPHADFVAWFKHPSKEGAARWVDERHLEEYLKNTEGKSLNQWLGAQAFFRGRLEKWDLSRGDFRGSDFSSVIFKDCSEPCSEPHRQDQWFQNIK